MLKKDRIYTDMQKAFLEAMRDPDNAGNIRHCMNLAGYAKNSPTGQVVGPLQDELVAIAKELMASHSIKATFSLISVLDSPALPGAANVINAAKQVLDRANVVQKQEEVKLDVGKGIIILPAKGGVIDSAETVAD